MCRCNDKPDPRDEIGHAERALFGLNRLLCEMSPGNETRTEDIQPILGLIVDKLRPASDEIMAFVPRDFNQPAA